MTGPTVTGPPRKSRGGPRLRWFHPVRQSRREANTCVGPAGATTEQQLVVPHDGHDDHRVGARKMMRAASGHFLSQPESSTGCPRRNWRRSDASHANQAMPGRWRYIRHRAGSGRDITPRISTSALGKTGMRTRRLASVNWPMVAASSCGCQNTRSAAKRGAAREGR